MKVVHAPICGFHVVDATPNFAIICVRCSTGCMPFSDMLPIAEKLRSHGWSICLARVPAVGDNFDLMIEQVGP